MALRKITIGRLSAMALITLSFGFVVYFLGVFADPSRARAATENPDSALSLIAKYREWKLVNPSPWRMQPLDAGACAVNIGSFEHNPHKHHYVSVYVNSVGESAMMAQSRPVFPEGSIIVKEKRGDLVSPDSPAVILGPGDRPGKAPEVLTVMLKREKGYDPQTRDWEFLVLDGAASKIVERGKLVRCRGCHLQYGHSDLITRIYLPADAVHRLK